MSFSPLTQWLWFADVNKTGFLHSPRRFWRAQHSFEHFQGAGVNFFRHARTDNLRALTK